MRLLFSMSMVVAACSLVGCSSSDDAMPEEKEGDVINLFDRSKAFYLIPNQVLTTLQVSYKGVDSNTYTKKIDIKPILLVAGRHYIFNLAINN